MKPKLSIGQALLAWVNMIAGAGTLCISLWAFLATLTDLELKLTAYYLFGIAFGAFFMRSGFRKLWPRPSQPESRSEVEHETPQ
ncbi:hypothetical protein [Pseudomonas fluorescens]|uniref:hypothetical protein n=1 Tax=Pseudomonas fluorescens TaxID=294 RepID=UPI00372D63E7